MARVRVGVRARVRARARVRVKVKVRVRARVRANPRATLRRSVGLHGGNCAGRRLDSTTKEEGDWPSTGGVETD